MGQGSERFKNYRKKRQKQSCGRVLRILNVANCTTYCRTLVHLIGSPFLCHAHPPSFLWACTNHSPIQIKSEPLQGLGSFFFLAIEVGSVLGLAEFPVGYCARVLMILKNAILCSSYLVISPAASPGLRTDSVFGNSWLAVLNTAENDLANYWA